MKIYLIAFLLAVTSLNKTQAQQLNKIDEPAFKPGEKLSYKMKYGIFTAAEANIRVEETPLKFEDKPSYHIIAEGKTAGTFDVFYKVRNRYETYVDEQTIEPYFYAENRHESNYKHTDIVVFNHRNHTIKAKKGIFPLEGKVFDFLSSYYYARCIDVSKLQIGEKMDIQYFLEDGVHTLTITYMGKEKVTCSMGTFNCLKFNPTIIPGRIFRKDSKLYLWITDDGNRIPVKAHVELIVGSLNMDLTAASGLKYPLNPVSKD
ncbi:DUF3108 domain-containing protein [Mucilaginibacter sp.]|jgi:hypothetical protein|uniref:DUF3108 domain-containing protein n=1 Tax=Mucilaginibacter sp. TaxID=1882438 RepID=UPI002C7ECF9F|nr:DUF3108 domain-containing protein [Mucilaginibacter sp.]HTI59655.1 DUF3108 domain-containing protein [Mucilaginibacter sp.]